MYNLVAIDDIQTPIACYEADTLEFPSDGMVVLKAYGKVTFAARLAEGYALIQQPPA
jgi:hypothetical protein